LIETRKETVLMNPFYKKSTQTLELPKILERLARHATSPMAKEAALALTPTTYLRDAQIWQDETTAACQMMVKKGSPSFYGVQNVAPAVFRAERGAILTMAELLQVAALLQAARTVRDYRYATDEAATCLDTYFSLLRPHKELEQSISTAIISDTEMADTASPALAAIRRKIRLAHERIRESLAKLISSPTQGKLLQEAIITQRNGRYVVPVRAEHKNDLPGLAHDVSASGATVFIEPMAVVEANNEISLLSAEEKKEMERILAELSARVVDHKDGILLSLEQLTALDLIFAKAKLSYEQEALPPKLNSEGIFRLKRARHPLLDPKTVVPIDFSLGGDFQTLIITGPNTGGKTVTLKTAGLLTLMAACGLHIPAADDSTVPVCSGVYADIGDEQSIEQSLSTFSSHMTNIVQILNCADENSLVLFDELGAGTDPVEGAALAMAIIERAAAKGAKIVATTHYAELKVYALNTENVENASCEFSMETLRPTFRLLIGVPGRSNAFAISQRLGLPEDVIAHAKSLINEDASRFEDVIARLEENRQKLEEDRQVAQRLRREIEQLEKRAKEREKQYEADKQKLYAKARSEAEDLLQNARAEAEAILDEVRELRRRAEREAMHLAINETASDVNRRFNTLEDAVAPVLEQENDGAPPSAELLVPGTAVKLIKMGVTGTVLSPPDANGQVAIQAGILKVNAAINDLRLADAPKKVKAPKLTGLTFAAPSNQDSAAANRLDLRGMSADEAILEVDRFIDAAVRQHIPAATIVHGKGTGKLRDVVRAHLNRHRQVKNYRAGVYGEGDTGVTIIEF
jgi:DNA mismatch repair protein MutS2